MNKLCVALLAAGCTAGAVALATASAPTPFREVADVKVEKKTLKKPGYRKPATPSAAAPQAIRHPEVRADNSAQTRSVAAPVVHAKAPH